MQEAFLIEHAHPLLHVDESLVEKLVYRVVEGEHKSIAYLGIILADHETVLALNREYLAHDYNTDVLAFSYENTETSELIDGEVYVDLDTAHERHSEFGTSFENEVYRYVIHGLLHLAGYNDDTPSDRIIMQKLEDRYLEL